VAGFLLICAGIRFSFDSMTLRMAPHPKRFESADNDRCLKKFAVDRADVCGNTKAV
jgi:hypothetical protein